MRSIFKPQSLPNCVSTGLLLLRVVAGLAFAHHGYAKMQNPLGWMGPDSTIPSVFLLLAAISEFAGGIAWILGAIMPIASFLIACTMAVAISMHLLVFHDPFVNLTGGGSYELASVFFCIAILFLLAGPGRFSLDRLIFGERV